MARQPAATAAAAEDRDPLEPGTGIEPALVHLLIPKFAPEDVAK